MTKLSPRPLAHYVDDLIESSRIVVSEGIGASITISDADTAVALELVNFLNALSWTVSVEDASGFSVSTDSIQDGLSPYSLSFQKPLFTDGIGFIATSAFQQWLFESPTAVGIIRVASAVTTFSTLGFIVSSWDEHPSGFVTEPLRSPRDLVRSAGSSNPVPADVRPFLLSKHESPSWGDIAFTSWLRTAYRALVYSLAADAAQTSVGFVGPPRIRFDVDSEWNPDSLTAAGFMALQNAARWIYEVDREAEIRHTLFSHEFARLALRNQNIASALAEFCELALDGARITYDFGLQEQNKDAMKSLSDLRADVSDETSRTAETLRQLALNTAAALFYGLGLLAGKATTSVSPWLLDTMGLLGAAYLGAIITTNARFLSQQKQLRNRWRQKLYRYLTDVEYAELVTTPIGSLEDAVVVVLWLAGALGVVMFASVLVNDHTDFLNAALASIHAT